MSPCSPRPAPRCALRWPGRKGTQVVVRWAQALGVVVTASLLAACGSGASSTTATTQPGAVSSSPQQGHLPPPMYPVPPRPTQSTSSPATPSPHPSSPQPSADATPAAVPPTKVLVFMVENHSARRDAGPDAVDGGARRPLRLRDDVPRDDPPLAAQLPRDRRRLDLRRPGRQRPRAATRSAARRCSGGRSQVGSTARLYAEAMPGTCVTTPAGEYAVKHNPWAYFVDERADCDRYDVPLDELAARRPRRHAARRRHGHRRHVPHRPRLPAGDRRRLAEDRGRPGPGRTGLPAGAAGRGDHRRRGRPVRRQPGAHRRRHRRTCRATRSSAPRSPTSP